MNRRPHLSSSGCAHGRRTAAAAVLAHKKNPPGLSRWVLSQLSRGMSYEIRDCSNGSRRRLTNIPAGKPAGREPAGSWQETQLVRVY